MFRALLAHLQEASHKQHVVYCALFLSVGWTQYNNCLCSASWRWASNARNMYSLLIHNKLITKSASLWIYCTDILYWYTVLISKTCYYANVQISIVTGKCESFTLTTCSVHKHLNMRKKRERLEKHNRAFSAEIQSYLLPVIQRLILQTLLHNKLPLTL
jgi:hypothetical protein